MGNSPKAPPLDEELQATNGCQERESSFVDQPLINYPPQGVILSTYVSTVHELSEYYALDALAHGVQMKQIQYFCVKL